MVRVLHVVTIMNRNGLENRLMDIYRNIDKNKVQFDFLTHRKQRGQFDDEIEKMGGHIYYMPRLKPLKFISYMKELYYFFREHREYKIVHSHVNTISTWVLFAAKKAGIPIRIAHSRTWGMEKNWKSIFKWFSKIFINIPTTHKFACSQQAGKWLFGSKGIKPPQKFKVIPNSIDIEKFTFDIEKRQKIRKELAINENQLAIINVARLTSQKNHIYLIHIFNEILKIKQNSKLFLIGDGELKEKIIKECKKLNIENQVIMLGMKENVGDYLNAMDCFIFPSYFEGFGTVTIEAQCNGLTILASDTIPEETKVTEIMEFMSINEKPQKWADEVIKLVTQNANIDRKKYFKKIKNAGYDIKDTYLYLEEFYSSVI